ncbi:MAG: hypothetical protein WC389_17825, partial [Lutibacter sp.]
MDIIEKLQNKPKKTRVFILWLASAFVMIIVIIVWLLSFSGNTNKENAKNDLTRTELPSLFESIKQDFSTFKQKISEGFKEIKTKTEEVEQQSE